MVETKHDGERIDVVEGDIGSAYLKQPNDIGPVEDGLSEQGALKGVDAHPAHPADPADPADPAAKTA